MRSPLPAQHRSFRSPTPHGQAQELADPAGLVRAHSPRTPHPELGPEQRTPHPLPTPGAAALPTVAGESMLPSVALRSLIAEDSARSAASLSGRASGGAVGSAVLNLMGTVSGGQRGDWGVRLSLPAGNNPFAFGNDRPVKAQPRTAS